MKLDYVARAIKYAEAVAAEGEPTGAVETVGDNANLEGVETEAEETSADGMWDELLSSHESDDLGEPEEVTTEAPTIEEVAEIAAEEPAGQEPAVEVPEPIVEPEVVVEPEETPPAEPEQPAVTDPKAQEQTPEQKQAVRQELQIARGKVEEQLTGLYALSDEDAQNLQLEPEKVLPAIAARLHMNIIEALHEGIQTQLPNMIKAVNKRSKDEDKNIGAFYEAWPALKDSKYNDTVLRSMQAYRQANPKATTAQMTREGGAMAMVALQLPITAAPTTSAPPAARTAPVVPLAPGGGTIPAVTSPSDNPFAQMFEDAFEEEM